MKRQATLRVGGGLVLLIAAAVPAGGCAQAETSTQASASSQSTSPRPSSTGSTAPADAAIVLEFEVPSESWTPPAGSADVVTGFRVGYFWPNESTALRTVDFGRDALAVQDRTVRVTLPRETVPECASDCVIRVQTLTAGRASAWSAPVPLSAVVTRQAQLPPRQQRPPAARPERTPNAAPARTRQRAGLAPRDIESYASLSESLRQLLPPDANLDAELRRFRRVEELALAVVISRDYDIPFTTLSRTLEGPPRTSPRNALVKLRPDLDAGAFRRARDEAGRLISPPSR